MRNPERTAPLPVKAYSYLAIAALCWAANAIVGKVAVGHVSPMMLTLLRWMLACLVIVVMAAPHLKKDWPQMRSHWPLLLAYGAVGYTAFNAFLYSALQYTSAVNSAIEQAGIPILIFALNFLFFSVRVTALQIAGFLLTLAGIAITAAGGDLATLLSLELNFGDFLMIFCLLSYAVYTVALRWRPPLDWRNMMAVTALGAIIAAIPLTIWEASRGSMIMPDTIGWLAVLFTGIFPSLVSQILFVKGVDRIGANRAGLFINLIPVFGTLLSVSLLGEALQTFHVVALALVIAGIAIAEKGKSAAA